MKRARGLLTLLSLAILFAVSACPGASRPRLSGPASMTSGSIGPLRDNAMRVHMIDVGQGAATLLEFPCAAVLIDTGGESNPDIDAVARLRDYLDAFFATRPDLDKTLALLVITHPHIDHVRGAKMVTERYRVERLLTDGIERDDIGGAEQTELLRWARGRKLPEHIAIAREVPAGGLTNELVDPVACKRLDPKITLLWGAVGEREFDWSPYAVENMNNYSVVLRVDAGASSLLITGDLQVQALPDFIDKHAGTDVLDVDVYQVGHHGAFNGTSDALLAAVTPAIALIPCGDPDRRHDWTAWAYGHPRRGIVETLARTVTDKRKPARAQVAEATRSFVEMPLFKAVYGSGWDGHVIVELRDDGSRQVWTER